MNWYKEIPKVEIHLHLEGAIPYPALWELIKKYGGDPSVLTLNALEQRFVYKNFQQFIETWIWKNNFLREYEDFTTIAELTARDLVKQNILYAEVFCSPSSFYKKGLGVRELISAIRKGFDKVPEIELALIVDFVRNSGPENEWVVLENLMEVKDLGVIGIGIGGSEHEFPPEPFEKFYHKAREMGFHTTAHAGEAAGPESIWGALKILQAERIGHGTMAYQDPFLVEYIREKKIPVEMCPLSNIKTAVVRTLAEHPIKQYFKKGLMLSVNTDDPKMFGNSLSGEYEALVSQCGFSRKDICRLIKMGIESSWLSGDKKIRLIQRFEKNPLWIKD
jgi:adenosine deaminase